MRMDDARGIFVVADGMGGHAAGEIASRLAADAVLETLRGGATDGVPDSETMEGAYHRAYERIVSCCNDDPTTRGMGTTLTTLVLDRTGRALIGHIGDSRVYRLSNRTLEQLTNDHTWVQGEIDAGRLPLEAATTHPLAHILS